MNLSQIVLVGLLAQAPTPPSASIEGTVITASGAPLSKATVIVGVLAPEGTFVMESLEATASDDGRFAFRNLAEGRYRLAATRAGFARTEYPEAIKLAAGEKVDLRLTIKSAGAIAGRVRDGRGEPLGAAQVEALRSVWVDGRRTLAVVQSAQSNDLGNYRLFGLPPGQYFVRATPVDVSTLNLSVALGSKEARGRDRGERLVPVYFPGTTDWKGASPIEVRAGDGSYGMDFVAAAARTGRVRGTVADFLPGQSTAVTLALRDPAPGSTVLKTTSDPATGTFELPGVIPGSYVLIASAHDERGRSWTGRISVEVGLGGENVRIGLTDGVLVPGHASIEGRPPVPDRADIENLRFSISPVPRIAGTETDNYGPLPDGSFTLSGLPPGDHRLTVTALPSEGDYVKSIRLGDMDVTNGKIHIDGSIPAGTRLELVIGTNPGTMDGIVTNDKREPATSTTVVLLPADVSRRGGSLDRSVSTGASNVFRFNRLPPGEYKVFAWQDLDNGAWQDPEFMRLYEDRGRPLKVEEGKRLNIELTVILL